MRRSGRSAVPGAAADRGAEWLLSYGTPRSLSIAECERAMATAVDSITTTIGELEGNPRDFYARRVTIEGTRDGVALALSASQGMLVHDDPEPIISSVTVRATGPAAQKLAAWPTITAAFERLGCVETTYAHHAAAIIDEADARGDVATATRVREATLAALVAQARHTAHVAIRAPRVDVEPILAAYEAAERIVSVSLSDCGLTALPAGLARFPAIVWLSLHENGLDGSAFRGLARPALRELTLQGAGLRRFAKQDLEGLPALEALRCDQSGLEELDPDLIEVCPKLRRVSIDGTPLAADEARMVALRARWPLVRWSEREASGAPKPRAARARPPRSRTRPPAPSPRPPPVDPGPPSFEDGVLSFDSPSFPLARIRALIRSGEYRDARELRFRHGDEADGFLRFVATSRAFPALVALSIGSWDLTDRGVRALATEAVGLDHLEEVDLGEGERDQLKISDDAVEALARSPRLPALRKITRGIEHHVYGGAARDGTEVTRIERPDGRVVESVLHHTVWP